MDHQKLEEFRIPRIKGHGCSFLKAGGMLTAPLSPRLIEIMGEGNLFPDASGFDPSGNWLHHYRVWTNHGDCKAQNKNTGHISIARNAQSDSVNFQVRQVIVNQDGMFQRIEAEINCSNDAPGSVQNWQTRIYFYDTSQCPMADMNLEITGTVSPESVQMTVNGATESYPLTCPLLCQWLICDCIQRNRKRLDDFSVLEHGMKLKPHHCLIPSQPVRPEATNAAGTLALTVQRGHGLLPWEYWQDTSGRVLYAFSGTVMYILDEDAPGKTDALIEELVQGGHHYEY